MPGIVEKERPKFLLRRSCCKQPRNLFFFTIIGDKVFFRPSQRTKFISAAEKFPPENGLCTKTKKKASFRKSARKTTIDALCKNFVFSVFKIFSTQRTQSFHREREVPAFFWVFVQSSRKYKRDAFWRRLFFFRAYAIWPALSQTVDGVSPLSQMSSAIRRPRFTPPILFWYSGSLSSKASKLQWTPK